ncbi:ureidoglycolate hydrolase [Globomyces pollinis-pini]|nr:ureidoglycolate hydrolase [Globomyces pollinis-pini]KAJ2996259.1 hypothetical protein HDV02_006656 [Globomyces sp. JEL0801]
MIVHVQPLVKDKFSEFGDVLEIPEVDCDAKPGTTSYHMDLTRLVNMRLPGAKGVAKELTLPAAKDTVSIFRVQPSPIPLSVSVLERHRYSSQMFIPMTGQKSRYLVIVAQPLPSDKPDLTTIKVFEASSTQAFNYHPGTWHRSMIVLDHPIDFVVVDFNRDGNQLTADEDCEEYFFRESPIHIDYN